MSGFRGELGQLGIEMGSEDHGFWIVVVREGRCEAGVCRGEAVDVIYGGAHRSRVQVQQCRYVLLSSSSKKSILIILHV